MSNLITVKCNKAGIWDRHLTKGKEYSVMASDEDVYQLIDDTGKINFYFRYRFETIKQD